MKICYLANAVSTHTKRWAKAMVDKGCSVEIISFDDANIDGVIVHHVKPVKREMNKSPSDPKNLTYMAKYGEVKKIIKDIKPDIIHAHYATGYGFTGALCNCHPFVISTWGTDIFEAPKKNFIFKNIVRFNLMKADYITATSQALTKETQLYTSKKVYTIPFGIDMKKFIGYEKKDKDIITIGIVKSLEEVYGIKYLVEAFSKVNKKYQNTELLIVGGGTLYNDIKDLCKELGILDKVKFAGRVPNDDVPKYLNMMDIFVMPSMRESFGVAALEAGACEVPVIASRVEGIPEVVVNSHTGFLVEPCDSGVIAEKIEVLIGNKTLRESMGKNAREFVNNNYNWQKNVEDMYKLYSSISGF